MCALRELPFYLPSQDRAQDIRYGPRTTIHLIDFDTIVRQPETHDIFKYAPTIAVYASTMDDSYGGSFVLFHRNWVAVYLGHCLFKTVYAIYDGDEIEECTGGMCRSKPKLWHLVKPVSRFCSARETMSESSHQSFELAGGTTKRVMIMAKW